MVAIADRHIGEALALLAFFQGCRANAWVSASTQLGASECMRKGVSEHTIPLICARAHPCPSATHQHQGDVLVLVAVREQ